MIQILLNSVAKLPLVSLGFEISVLLWNGLVLSLTPKFMNQCTQSVSISACFHSSEGSRKWNMSWTVCLLCGSQYVCHRLDTAVGIKENCRELNGYKNNISSKSANKIQESESRDIFNRI